MGHLHCWKLGLTPPYPAGRGPVDLRLFRDLQRAVLDCLIVQQYSRLHGPDLVGKLSKVKDHSHFRQNKVTEQEAVLY
jgi:hypothetical protein